MQETLVLLGSGRSAGEGIGYPLLYSWASLVAQLVKNPPAMQETWVRSLGWEDPLEQGKATHSRILALGNSMDCVAKCDTTLTQVTWGGEELDTTEQLSLHFTSRIQRWLPSWL